MAGARAGPGGPGSARAARLAVGRGSLCGTELRLARQTSRRGGSGVPEVDGPRDHGGVDVTWRRPVTRQEASMRSQPFHVKPSSPAARRSAWGRSAPSVPRPLGPSARRPLGSAAGRLGGPLGRAARPRRLVSRRRGPVVALSASEPAADRASVLRGQPRTEPAPGRLTAVRTAFCARPARETSGRTGSRPVLGVGKDASCWAAIRGTSTPADRSVARRPAVERIWPAPVSARRRPGQPDPRPCRSPVAARDTTVAARLPSRSGSDGTGAAREPQPSSAPPFHVKRRSEAPVPRWADASF
jgi:hypothetical protein